MKEVIEFRINHEFAPLLFGSDEGKDLGQITKSVKVVNLTRDDPRFNQIPLISNEVKEKYGKAFFFSWKIRRLYSKQELNSASLFHLNIQTIFEPTGEECGTIYDETMACEMCGSDRKQVGVLKLRKGSIPKKDVARTIAGEIIVSERFAETAGERNLKGINFKPIVVNGQQPSYFQLNAKKELDLSHNTIAGVTPFDFSETSEESEVTLSNERVFKLEHEVYKCPRGHTIGLNLLSEPHIIGSSLVGKYDLFVTRQKIGVRRGLLRPEPLYLCSPKFRKMVQESKLRGFDFEIAHVDKA